MKCAWKVLFRAWLLRGALVMDLVRFFSILSQNLERWYFSLSAGSDRSLCSVGRHLIDQVSCPYHIPVDDELALHKNQYEDLKLTAVLERENIYVTGGRLWWLGLQRYVTKSASVSQRKCLRAFSPLWKRWKKPKKSRWDEREIEDDVALLIFLETYGRNGKEWKYLLRSAFFVA